MSNISIKTTQILVVLISERYLLIDEIERHTETQSTLQGVSVEVSNL